MIMQRVKEAKKPRMQGELALLLGKKNSGIKCHTGTRPGSTPGLRTGANPIPSPTARSAGHAPKIQWLSYDAPTRVKDFRRDVGFCVCLSDSCVDRWKPSKLNIQIRLPNVVNRTHMSFERYRLRQIARSDFRCDEQWPCDELGSRI